MSAATVSARSVAISTSWSSESIRSCMHGDQRSKGDYEEAIQRWPSLAEDWADVPHRDYCARLDGNIKCMRNQGVPIRAVAPIIVDDYVGWCEQHDEDPEEARASYAAHRMSDGEVIAWPPGRNEPCWCGSGRKYKKCCGPAPARPMHDPEP